MASTYYKYAERSADSQLNWAEIGKEASGMLLEVNRVREAKKDAYEQQTRDDLNNLMNAPQGKNQKVSDFTNNFAHDMINQKKIDYDLFKRGEMSERDYTLRVQNQMDGTNQLFELSKLYQEKFQSTMDGIASGKLQAGINIFNKSAVEGYANFDNSKAMINPNDGTVNVGLYENKIIDGKTVRVLSKNIAPVNVIRNQIMQDIPAFDVDSATTKTVAGFGTRKDILYKQASLNGAGSITEYMGPTFLATLKDPVDKKIVSDMNDAINKQIDSYFTNPYNLTSVLTENTGVYDSESFTFDRDEAIKNPKKILVEVDPNTNMTTLDKTGPNYEAQKKEASDWVRTDMLRKMDEERSIKPVAQLERRDEPEWKAKKADADKENLDAVNMLGKLWYGNENQVQSSIDYIKGLRDSKGQIMFQDVIRDPKEGVTVTLADGTKENISFLDSNGRPRTQEDFIASAGPLLVGQIDVRKATKSSSFNKNAKFNTASYGRGTTVKEFELSTDVLRKPSEQAVLDISNSLPEGFTAKDIGGYFGNEVEVTSPSGKKYIVETRKGVDAASSIALGLEDFINLESKKAEEARLADKEKPAADKKTKTKNAKGVGSKY